MGSSVDEIENIADKYWDDGIKHIVALRGDVPKKKILSRQKLEICN